MGSQEEMKKVMDKRLEKALSSALSKSFTLFNPCGCYIFLLVAVEAKTRPSDRTYTTREGSQVEKKKKRAQEKRSST